MYSHAAVFAEVKVDPDPFQIRVTRLVGAYAAGRIINPKLAESQLLGGMIWGISFALHEDARFDPHSGRIMNADFAGYHIPVNADVTGLEVITIHEDDPYVNALGVKGVGEIGITGTVGAIEMPSGTPPASASAVSRSGSRICLAGAEGKGLRCAAGWNLHHGKAPIPWLGEIGATLSPANRRLQGVRVRVAGYWQRGRSDWANAGA